MPDAPGRSSHLKFSNDLRRIRLERDLTLEALHGETKIPLGVLQEFEESGLFDNPMFNRVYLRSLVRAYASFLDIPVKQVLEALDEALLDRYEGRLAVDFLGAAPPAPGPEETEPAQAGGKPAGEAAPPAVEKSEDERQPAVAPPEARAPEVEVPKKEAPEPGTPEPGTPEPGTPVPTTTEGGGAVAGATGTPLKEYVKGEARAAPPLLTTAEAGWAQPGTGTAGRRSRPVDAKRRASYTQWVVIVGAVLLFAAAIWVVLALLERPTDASLQPPVAVDTTTVDTTAVAEPLRPRVVLGDTLDVVVVAVTKVERINIRRDNDVRRPYWIEEGVAKAFPAMERIVLENRLDRIRLLLEGYEYPTTLRDEQGRLVITRETAQAFIDTLTRAPVVLPVAPDTVRMMPVRSQ